MVSKKILGVAIAAAFSAQAFATIDLTGDTGGVKFAKENVLTANVTAGYTTLTNAANKLDIQTAVGSGVSSGNQIYVRFDLTNAKFASAVTAGMLTSSGVADGVNSGSITVQSGGASGGTYVIFQITADTDGIAQADTLTLALATLSVSAIADANVTYAAYDSASAAVNQVANNRLSTSTYNPVSGAAAIAWGNAFSATYTSANATADVASSFTNYVTTNTYGKLGTVKFSYDASFLKTNGTAVAALSDLVDTTAKVKIATDISFGTWGVSTSAVCAAPTAFADDAAIAGVALDTLTIAAFTANTAYNVCNDDTVAATINDGSYTMSVAAATLAGGYNVTAATSGNAVGSIVKNGTSIQVPYLTTYADYTQRLVLVNRGSTAAPYSVTFRPETGKTVASGSLVSGSIPAGKTLVIPVRQDASVAAGLIDSLAAGTTTTRTAATVIVIAQSANIDAVTTMVNATDKSTDTVKLQ